MKMYMLDANVLIDIVREPEGVVARHFGTKSLGELGVSVVVSGEVQYGIKKRPDARSSSRMAYLLDGLRIEQMAPEVCDFYSGVRAEMERRGLSLSANDYWIAAHAICSDAVLVTGDRAIHDAGIAGLKLEDWRHESPDRE